MNIFVLTSAIIVLATVTNSDGSGQPVGEIELLMPFNPENGEFPEGIAIDKVAAFSVATAKGGEHAVGIHVSGVAVEPLPPEEHRALVAKLRQRLAATARGQQWHREDLTKKHGNNFDKWPEEDRATFEAAIGHNRFAFHVLAKALLFQENSQKDVDDSVRDLKGRFRKKKHVRLVEDPEEASLLIIVLGRGSISALWKYIRQNSTLASMELPGDIETSGEYLYFRVSGGPALNLPQETLKAISLSMPGRSEGPPETPYWGLWTQAHAYRFAAEEAAQFIDAIVKSNIDSFERDRTAQNPTPVQEKKNGKVEMVLRNRWAGLTEPKVRRECPGHC